MIKKLSIIVPVYNEERTIKKILKKISKQKYVKKEIIVINDASSDNTLQILEELGFYNPAYSQSSGTSTLNNSSAKSEEKPKKNNQNVVEDLKELNDLYKSGVISLEEFEKAKKKLLN